MPPPSHYQWADEDWQLDMTGPWADEILGLGKKHDQKRYGMTDRRFLQYQSLNATIKDGCTLITNGLIQRADLIHCKATKITQGL